MRGLIVFLLVVFGVTANGQKWLGDWHARHGRLVKAEKAYWNGYLSNPNAQILSKANAMAVATDQYDKALSRTRGLPEANPDSIGYILETAHLYQLHDEHEQVLSLLLAHGHLAGQTAYDSALRQARENQKISRRRMGFATISPKEELNSPANEFGLVRYQEEQVFTTDVLRDLVYRHGEVSGQPYYQLAKWDTGKIGFFHPSLVVDAHIGPVQFLGDSLMVVTRVSSQLKGKDVQNPMFLEFYIKAEKGWQIVPSLTLSGEGDRGHGFWIDEGKSLLFAAELPGGEGGLDLYMVTREHDAWSQPIHLGDAVNSAGDEIFPVLGPDRTLIFATNGIGGYGKHDLYVAPFTGTSWGKPVNLGPDINSGYSDYAMHFESESTGTFSSERFNGEGGADIYAFELHKPLLGAQTMRGQFFYSALKAGAGVRLMLMDENNELIATAITDVYGEFEFDGLEPDRTYFVRLDVPNPNLGPDARMYLLNDSGVQVVKLDQTGEHVFVFDLLPSDDIAALEPIADENYTLMFIDVAGRVYEKLPGDIPPGLKVALVNDDGVVLLTADVLKDGTFVFEQLPADDLYQFELMGDIEDVTFEMIDQYGEVIRTLKADKFGRFDYAYLSPEKLALALQNEEDQSSLLGLSIMGEIYQKLPGDLPAGMEVMLVDDEGNILQIALTDAKGRFVFENLPPDASYSFKIKDVDDVQFRILDENEEVTAILVKNKLGNFNFQRLEKDKGNLIVLLDEHDVELVIEEQEQFVNYSIYYELDQWQVNAVSAQQLDKLVLLLMKNPHIKVELSSHTDARASDDYNLALSQKRADAAVDYVLSKGIANGRVVAIGLGEQQLQNHCSNGVSCTEKQHAANRRTEIRILKR